MRLSVLLIQNTLFDGEVKSVTLKTPGGEITVLHNHEPIVSLVEYGDLKYVDESGESHTLHFPGGVLEVQPNGKVVVLAKQI